MRQVATLLMLSSAWWLAFSPSLVRAQSSETQQPESADQDDSEKKQEESGKEEVLDAQAEFDTRILGPWVALSKISAGALDTKLIKPALARCFTTPKLPKLNIEPDAARKLPDPENLSGDMVYYRTDKGLQRFDFSQGFLVLLTELEKLESDGKPVSWKISGPTLRYRIRFANAQSRGGKGEFMVENDQLYLRCPRPDKDKKTTGE